MIPRGKVSLDMQAVCEAAGTALRKFEAEKRVSLRQHISAQRAISPKTVDHWGKDQRPKPDDTRWMIKALGDDYCVLVVRELGRTLRWKTIALLIFQAALMAAKGNGHDPSGIDCTSHSCGSCTGASRSVAAE